LESGSNVRIFLGLGFMTFFNLYVNNTALPFVHISKLLGFLLEIILSWEPLTRWLRVKCEQPLDVLEVLYGRLWGGV
jgi:hypothetical protein